jgi:GNAT superfamily N-acetyltransferase
MVHPIDLTLRGPANHPKPALRVAKPEDLKILIELHKPESKSLGFLPAAAVSAYISWRSVIIGDVNDDDLSFLLFRHNSRDYPGITLIHQACVRQDARHIQIGTALIQRVAQAARMKGDAALQLWCRGNLEANRFWHALGFEPVAIKAGGKKRNIPVIGWRFPLVSGARLTHSVVKRRRNECGASIPLANAEQQAEVIASCSTDSTAKLLSFWRSLSRISSSPVTASGRTSPPGAPPAAATTRKGKQPGQKRTPEEQPGKNAGSIPGDAARLCMTAGQQALHDSETSLP